MRTLGIDVGSTTVKAVFCEGDAVLWRDYQRHNTHQAEKVLEFLVRLEAECGLQPGRDRLFFTGSGAGVIAPLVGGRIVQEVVAVAAAVERLHPDVHFVSEIGGEDMKTIFFTASESGKGKQIYMQSACSGGTGTFIEKTARKLRIPPEDLARMPYDGHTLHKISSKCGIFAEADANSLLKSGVKVEEIVASLFEAVVYQNLATLTKGNTPMPQVLLLGGPNCFFLGLQQAWRHHLGLLWQERGVALPEDATPEMLITVPADALYYGALGCVEVAGTEPPDSGRYVGGTTLRWWVEEGQHAAKAKEGGTPLGGDPAALADFRARYGATAGPPPVGAEGHRGPVILGCDFGSTTAKAVALAPDGRLLHTAYTPSKGNPIEDARALFRDISAAGLTEIGALALTGYGKDLLRDILGADEAVVETVAHARSAIAVFPDADVICDVGGTDVKIMMLRQGTVADFRLNSQCSSGNGAFLQGVAERYGIRLEDYAEKAFAARAMPSLAMGCGVFLQSDIVNQQRKGWSAEEIMAALAAVLPLNVWVYAGQLNNLRAAGRRFVLQGGTHRNLAVVKAQVDFITARIPDAEIRVHPYAGEAGAMGAALSALDAWSPGKATRFRGFDAIEALTWRTTTSEDTVCRWCTVNCKRSFIDVELPGAPGRPWSKVPLEPGWQRVIAANSCPKGLVEDVNEMRAVKDAMEENAGVSPNIGALVREEAFRSVRLVA
ncbi:activase [Falsiroseomonas bella]|uniref:Activase n=1 Tax=Falsiroseomonas bella TaxID=2184016 RepID=A0A317F874_9PROT|nr:BadF/BadG/BcrA/BcrD ATPase family protein [Falsiroseomonas bella]PWS34955.1 activase [Falsiroseomonas bella]